MRQRGNKNLSFPPAFRDLSEKLLVKYSQLLTIANIPNAVLFETTYPSLHFKLVLNIIRMKGQNGHVRVF